MSIRHLLNDFFDSYEVTSSELFCMLEERIEGGFRLADIGIGKEDDLFKFHIATDFELLLDELNEINDLGFELVREKHLKTVHHYWFKQEEL